LHDTCFIPSRWSLANFVPADTNRVVAREIVNVQATPVHNPIMMRAGNIALLNRL
jgi:hypothetical protein